jgi:hypothetical protein
MLHRDLDRRVAREGNRPGEQLVEDDAERVEVGAVVDGSSPRLLRRQVLRRPDDRTGLCHLARCAGAGDSEVADLQAVVVVHQGVVRLDVAVDDPLPVREAKRSEDLARVVDRLADGKGLAARHGLLEGAAAEVLHRDVVRALGLPAVVDLNDVRMRQAGGVLRLTAEALDELLVGGVPLVQDLDRDPAAELLVLGEVDVRHPSGPELAQDAVAPVEERVDQGVGNRHAGPQVTFDPTGAGPPSPASRSGPPSSRPSRTGSRGRRLSRPAVARPGRTR